MSTAESPLPDLRLAGLLKRAQGLLLEGYALALAPFPVDARELAVLTLLAAEGPRSQQSMSDRLAIDRTTVVALIDTLSARGLVQRLPDPSDRRKNMIELTPAGQELRKGASPAIDKLENAFLAPLAPADRAKLKALLRTLITAAER